MQQKKQYLLRLAVIILFNLCVLGMFWMACQSRESTQAISCGGAAALRAGGQASDCRDGF